MGWQPHTLRPSVALVFDPHVELLLAGWYYERIPRGINYHIRWPAGQASCSVPIAAPGSVYAVLENREVNGRSRVSFRKKCTVAYSGLLPSWRSTS